MRLIDADALDWEYIEEEYCTTIDTVRACKCLVLNAPTIDAVQVVRCGECVYKPCKIMPYSYDYDFCPYGERSIDNEID